MGTSRFQKRFLTEYNKYLALDKWFKQPYSDGTLTPLTGSTFLKEVQAKDMI